MISFSKMSSVQFISFSYKITTIWTNFTNPACLKLQVVFFLHLKTLPTNPSFQSSGKEIPMDLHNHGISHPLHGYLSSEPPDLNAQHFWCYHICSLVHNMITNWVTASGQSRSSNSTHICVCYTVQTAICKQKQYYYSTKL